MLVRMHDLGGDQWCYFPFRNVLVFCFRVIPHKANIPPLLCCQAHIFYLHFLHTKISVTVIPRGRTSQIKESTNKSLFLYQNLLGRPHSLFAGFWRGFWRNNEAYFLSKGNFERWNHSLWNSPENFLDAKLRRLCDNFSGAGLIPSWILNTDYKANTIPHKY